MFDTALQLISDYFGKSFLISFFFPSLFFWMLNLALGVLSLGLDDVLEWWVKQDGQVQTFLTAAFVVWILFTAYVLRIFMGELTRLYEGRWGFLRFITTAMQERNKRTWKELRAREEATGVQIRALKARQEAFEKILDRDVPLLPYSTRVDVLAIAQEAAGLYDRVRDWTAEDYLDNDKWKEMLEQLGSLQVRIFALSDDELNKHTAEIGPGSKISLVFSDPYEFLKDLIGQLEQERLDIFQEWTESFPARLSWVRPTRLGNHLRAAETYSFLRYNLDSALAWPRLRETIPDKFAGRLSDAKINMDLMLVLTTLTLIFGTAWGVIFLAVPEKYLAVYKWVVIPIFFLFSLGIARIAYLNAARSALSYGELFKTAFDLYRWDALKALHLDLPPDLESEKKLWGEIGGLLYRNYPFKTPWKHPS